VYLFRAQSLCISTVCTSVSVYGVYLSCAQSLCLSVSCLCCSRARSGSCVAMCVLQCVAGCCMCCSVLHRVAPTTCSCCSVLHVLQYVAVVVPRCVAVLQYVAVCCSVLQCVSRRGASTRCRFRVHVCKQETTKEKVEI